MFLSHINVFLPLSLPSFLKSINIFLRGDSKKMKTLSYLVLHFEGHAAGGCELRSFYYTLFFSYSLSCFSKGKFGLGLCLCL